MVWVAEEVREAVSVVGQEEVAAWVAIVEVVDPVTEVAVVDLAKTEEGKKHMGKFNILVQFSSIICDKPKCTSM